MGMLPIEHLTLGFRAQSVSDLRPENFTYIDGALSAPGFPSLRSVQLVLKGPGTLGQVDMVFGTALKSLERRGIEFATEIQEE